MASIRFNGLPPDGKDVTDAGVKLLDKREARKCAVITNASDAPVYLSLRNSADGLTNTAEVGKGIFLSANGGAYEINRENLHVGEVWAIHGQVGLLKRVCIQEGT